MIYLLVLKSHDLNESVLVFGVVTSGVVVIVSVPVVVALIVIVNTVVGKLLNCRANYFLVYSQISKEQ